MARRFLHNLGSAIRWVTPVLYLFVILGPLLWIGTTGALQVAGLPLLMIGLFGLLLTRDFRLRLYGFLPKTPEQQKLYRQTVEMERQKQAALAQQVPQLIAWLYQQYLQFYPDWIHHPHDYYVPSLIKKIRQVKDNILEVNINQHVYFLKFVRYGYATPEGERVTEGALEVYQKNLKLLSMILLPSPADATHWKFLNLQYIQLGSWVEDFKAVARKIIAEEKERKRDERMD